MKRNGTAGPRQRGSSPPIKDAEKYENEARALEAWDHGMMSRHGDGGVPIQSSPEPGSRREVIAMPSSVINCHCNF